ncbi:MAG: DUF192 domain-containing protein [Burkholderiales bacterium]|nr:DUF192 domain-containing protein [Burkholderiales bacterium]
MRPGRYRLPLSTLALPDGGSIDLHRAERAWARTRGLLGRPPLAQREGLVISRCNSVHTFGMRYPIDVVFVDRNDTVAAIVQHLKPYRFAACWRAACVVELQAGEARRLGLDIGQTLKVGALRAID